MDERVWIGNDHGGYRLKLKLIEYLDKEKILYNDIGCHSEEIVRYPLYASLIASRISRGEIRRGILICSTGIGMSILANKYPGVRASLCHTEYDGRLTRQHNDSNCLCLGGRVTGEFIAVDILKAWLSGVYEGGRHEISLGMLKEAEKVNLTGECWGNSAEP